MKYIHEYKKDVAALFRMVAHDLKKLTELGKIWHVDTAFSYVFEVGMSDDETFADAVARGLSNINEGEKMPMMTIANMLRNEGRKEAIKETMTIADALRNEGRKEAKNETRAMADNFIQQGKIEVAQNLLAAAFSPEEVAKMTGLPLNKVSELVSNNS